jgi:2-polyprenyl-6-methoxyphenol hydroxylase-like FAD-dependent oxidoreductase
MRVVVAGGGIGGLAAALALQRSGVEVTVLERRTDLAKVATGAGLMVWHNGTSVLERLGVGDAVRAHSTPIERFEFRTWRGAPLAAWPVGELTRTLGSPTVGINRADLHAALAAALEPGTLRLGEACTGFAQDADGVTVELSGGGSERATLLIGADGINSAVRTRLHGPREARYAGYTTWRGVLDFPESDAPSGLARKLWGPGRRFLSYRIGDGRLYWLALTRAAAGGSDPEDGRRAAVLAAHRGWDAPVEAMIEATDESAIARVDITDHAPLRRWGEGRVTLLGDAAHAMTPNKGQGACQAIEDALVLSRQLVGEPDVAVALRAYEDARRRRTASIQRESRMIGRLGRWQTRVACGVRDRIIRASFEGMGQRRYELEMRAAP